MEALLTIFFTAICWGVTICALLESWPTRKDKTWKDLVLAILNPVLLFFHVGTVLFLSLHPVLSILGLVAGGTFIAFGGMKPG